MLDQQEVQIMKQEEQGKCSCIFKDINCHLWCNMTNNNEH